MNNIYIPTNKPEDWKQLLADPEKHWKTGYSAKALAYSWQKAKGFPRTVVKVFNSSGIRIFKDIDILLAFPEYTVPLKPYGSRASQNDIFVLAKANNELVSIMVEGKVDEPFGETVGNWKLSDQGGKKERLTFLCNVLNLDITVVDHIRYQLIHRTASSIIEAKKFNAKNALMLVHIFEKDKEKYRESLQDYRQFISLFGKEGRDNQITYLKKIENIKLYAGWVCGEKRFLNR